MNQPDDICKKEKEKLKSAEANKNSDSNLSSKTEVKVSKAPEEKMNSKIKENEISFALKKLGGTADSSLLNPQYYQNKRQFEVYKSQSQITSHLVDFTKSFKQTTIYAKKR